MGVVEPHIPKAYQEVASSSGVGFEPFSALQPWYFLRPSEFKVFGGGDGGASLVGFARRQDCDDWACFDENGGNETITLVEWTHFIQRIIEYPTMEAWMDSVREDNVQFSIEESE